jgi:hypothetical protein
MIISQIICVAGCLLSAIHAVFSLPVIVKVANMQLPSASARNLQMWTGLLMNGCWVAYGVFADNYLLAFAFLLGLLKYAVVLIQLALNIVK